MSNDGRNSILVVDDDEDAGQNLVDILVDLGYDVGVATDGFRALEMARLQTYEIALLDLKMPQMDGLTLASRLKAESRLMVVILTTAFANQDTLSVAQSRGIWKVFSKPLDMNRIIPCLASVVQQLASPLKNNNLIMPHFPEHN